MGGPTLSRLNSNFRSLHVPFGHDNTTAAEYGGQLEKVDWFHQAVHEEESVLPYDQYIYSFPNFNTVFASLDAKKQRLQAYPAEQVTTRVIPGKSIQVHKRQT